MDADKSAEAANAALNDRVAIAVALLATFLGICKVKDDNICQAMQQAQADKIDHWAFYQARNIREEVARVALTQLELAMAGVEGPERQKAYATEIEHQKAFAAEQAAKKDELRRQAEEDQKAYDTLNYRDDQFDLSDALCAIALSMFAVTALTRNRKLFYASMVPSGLGVMMGAAGLFGWQLHSDLLARALS
jgi:hypothetical protein